jgi:OmpA-OmpF porin, OOP family
VVGLAAVACGVVGGLVLATRNDDSNVATPAEVEGPPMTVPQTASAPDEGSASRSSVAVEPPSTARVESAPVELDPVESAPVESAPPTSTQTTRDPTPGIVPESTATIRNGQIFFEGAVPTAEDAQRIVALAVEILGRDNVFDNYVVDPRAADPNEGNVTVEDTINFATDSAELDATADPLLNQGLALLNLRPDMTVLIVGHTDARGSHESNAQLALARAESVKTWFVERGVDPNRLTVRGAGESEPLASNETPDGRRRNRRIQFFLENVLG